MDEIDFDEVRRQVESGEYETGYGDHNDDCEFYSHFDEEDCNCSVLVWRRINSGLWENWDIDNPPRASKSARPKHGMSGRSVFTIVDTIRRRLDKK